MSPECPECQAPFTGRRAETRAARVCKDCGHAFLLNPDGSTESLKKRKKKPKPEEAEAPSDSSAEGEGEAPAAGIDPDATVETEVPVAGGQDQAPGQEPAPAQDQTLGQALGEGFESDANLPPTDTGGMDPLFSEGVAAQGGGGYDPAAAGYPPGAGPGYPPADGQAYPQAAGQPGYPPVAGPGYPHPAGQGYPPQAGPGYPPAAGVAGSPDAGEEQLTPKKRGAPVALIPVMLVLGAGLGFGAAFIPGLGPEPPPPPPVEVPEVKPPPPTQLRFVKSDEAMWAGPLSSGAYGQVGVLPKGSMVYATTAELGSLLLVHDAMGRAGFISPSALAENPTGTAFGDCRRAPFEDEAACKARANVQHEACKTACSDPACTSACQESLSQCLPGCAQVAEAEDSSQGPAAKDERGRAKGKSKKRKGKGKKRGRRKGKGKAKASGADVDDDIFMPLPEGD